MIFVIHIWISLSRHPNIRETWHSNVLGEGSDPGGAAPTIVHCQHPGIDGMLVGQTAPVRGGREDEESEGGVEG